MLAVEEALRKSVNSRKDRHDLGRVFLVRAAASHSARQPAPPSCYHQHASICARWQLCSRDHRW